MDTPTGQDKLAQARATCRGDARLPGLCKHAYPWRELERQALDRDGAVAIVGYGSLLNPDSARRTMPDTPTDGHEPVIAVGARRVFDYAMSPAGANRHGPIEHPMQRAALNTVWTRDPQDAITGRLLRVSTADLPALRERERGYHLAGVLYVPWNHPRATPRVGYVLTADAEPVDGVVHTDASLLPHQRYTAICLEGARRVDPAFEHAFIQTTWLGDRVTPLSDYLNGIRDGLSDASTPT